MNTIELQKNDQIFLLTTNQQIQSYIDLLKIVNLVLKKQANQYDAQYMFEDIDFANFYQYCYNKPIPVKLAVDQEIEDGFKESGQTINVDQYLDLRKISVYNVECQKQDSQNVLLEFYREKLTEIKGIIQKLENNEDIDFDTVVDILNNIFEQMKNESKQVVPLMQQWVKEKKHEKLAANIKQIQKEEIPDDAESENSEVQTQTQRIQSEILVQVNNLSKIIEERRASQQNSAICAQSAHTQSQILNKSQSSKSQQQDQKVLKSVQRSNQQSQRQVAITQQFQQQIDNDVIIPRTKTTTHQQPYEAFQPDPKQYQTYQQIQSNVLQNLQVLQEQLSEQPKLVQEIKEEQEKQNKSDEQQDIQELLIQEIRKQSEMLCNLNEQNQHLSSQHLKSDIQSQIDEQTQFLEQVRKTSNRLQQIPDSNNKYSQIDQQSAILEQVKNNIKSIYEQVSEASQVLEYAKQDPGYLEYKSNEESQKPSNQFLENYQQLLNKAISQQKIASKILEQVNQSFDLDKLHTVKEYDAEQILQEFELICQRSKCYLSKLEGDIYSEIIQNQEEHQDCILSTLDNIIQRCNNFIDYINSIENSQKNLEEKQKFLKKNNSLKSLDRTYSYKSLHQLPEQQQIQLNLAELIRRQAQLMQEIIEVNQQNSYRSDASKDIEILKQQSERLSQVEQLNEEIQKSLSRASEQNLQNENVLNQKQEVEQEVPIQQDHHFQLEQPEIQGQIIDQSYNEWHQSLVKSVTQQVQNELELGPKNIVELEEQIKQSIHSQIKSQLQSKKNSLQNDFKGPNLETLIQDANKSRSSNAVEHAFRQSLLKQVGNQELEKQKSNKSLTNITLNNSNLQAKLNQSQASQQQQVQVPENTSQNSNQLNQSNQNQKSQILPSQNSQDLSKIRQQIKDNSQILESVKSSQRGLEIRESYLQDAQQQLEVSQKILEQVNSYRDQISNRSSAQSEKLKDSQTLIKVSQQIESNLIEKINEHQMVKDQVQQSQRSLMQSQHDNLNNSTSQLHQSQLESDAQLEQFVDQQIENMSQILAQVQEIIKQSEENVRHILNSVNQSKLNEKSESPQNVQQQSFVSANNPKYSQTFNVQNERKVQESTAPWHTLQDLAKDTQCKEQTQQNQTINSQNESNSCYSPFKTDNYQNSLLKDTSNGNSQIQNNIQIVNNLSYSQVDQKEQPTCAQSNLQQQIQYKPIEELQKSQNGTQSSTQNIPLLQQVPEESEEVPSNLVSNSNRKGESQRSIKSQASQKQLNEAQNTIQTKQLSTKQQFIENIVESKVMDVIQDTKLQFPAINQQRSSIRSQNDDLSEDKINNYNVQNQFLETQNYNQSTQQSKQPSKQFIENIVKTQIFEVLNTDAKVIQELPQIIQKAFSQKEDEQQFLIKPNHSRKDSQVSKNSEGKGSEKHKNSCKSQNSVRFDFSNQNIQVPPNTTAPLQTLQVQEINTKTASQQFIENVVASKVMDVLKDSKIQFQKPRKSQDLQDDQLKPKSNESSQIEPNQHKILPSEKFIQNIVESKVMDVIKQSKIEFRQPSPKKQNSQSISQVESSSFNNSKSQNEPQISISQSIQKADFITLPKIQKDDFTRTFLTPNKQIQIESENIEQEKSHDSTGESKLSSEKELSKKQLQSKSSRQQKKDLLNQKFEEIKLSLQKVSGSNNFIREQLIQQIQYVNANK